MAICTVLFAVGCDLGGPKGGNIVGSWGSKIWPNQGYNFQFQPDGKVIMADYVPSRSRPLLVERSTGTYTVSGNSLRITVTESSCPSRKAVNLDAKFEVGEQGHLAIHVPQSTGTTLIASLYMDMVIPLPEGAALGCTGAQDWFDLGNRPFDPQ
jgi:hypothetical protein